MPPTRGSCGHPLDEVMEITMQTLADCAAGTTAIETAMLACFDDEVPTACQRAEAAGAGATG